MVTIQPFGRGFLWLAVFVLAALISPTIAVASEKNNLPFCTSQMVRDTAAKAVEDVYVRIGLGKAAISSTFSNYIRQTLADYRESNRAALERATAQSADMDARDVRLCTTSEIGGMQIDVWIVTDDKDKGKWRTVVTNIGMGANGYAVSLPMDKPSNKEK